MYLLPLLHNTTLAVMFAKSQKRIVFPLFFSYPADADFISSCSHGAAQPDPPEVWRAPGFLPGISWITWEWGQLKQQDRVDTGEVVWHTTQAFTSSFGSHLLRDLVQGVPGKTCSICWLPDAPRPVLHVKTFLANRHHITCQKTDPTEKISHPKEPTQLPQSILPWLHPHLKPFAHNKVPCSNWLFSLFKIIQHSSKSVLQLTQAVLLTSWRQCCMS